jgi:hypothetical protein
MGFKRRKKVGGIKRFQSQGITRGPRINNLGWFRYKGIQVSSKRKDKLRCSRTEMASQDEGGIDFYSEYEELIR